MTLEQRKTQFQSLLKKYVFVVDLEATCTDTGLFPREEMEIIEFGGIVLERELGFLPERYKEAAVEFFIKPTIHPTLTDFCKGLTHIEQGEVDGGKSYVQSLTELSDFTRFLGDDWSWCSWGAFDKNIMVENGVMHGLAPLLPPERHFNLKVWYSNLNETKKGYGLDKAIAREGLTFQGQHHRALSDALNVAQILRRLHGS